MTTPAPLVPLPDAEGIFLLHSATPETGPVAGAPPPPSLVVIFGWMGASLVHLQKYTAGYNLLYPAASILLIRSQPGHFFRSARAQSNALKPAHRYIASHFSSADAAAAAAAVTKPTSDILVHSFSNGGCLQLNTLNSLFLSDPSPSAALQNLPRGIPARALVFDSCPGDTDLARTQLAFTAGLPRSPFVRGPARVLLALMYGVMKGWSLMTGSPSPLKRVADELNARLPPVPRLYIYSDVDDLIKPSEVEAHAAEAEAAGTAVTREQFYGTKHVSHVRGDPVRYWGAVQKLWDGDV